MIERPEEEVARPGSETNPGTSLLSQVKISDIFPSAQEYDNQGRLYRGLEDGLQYLAQKYGEDGLFIGPKEAQIADAYFSMPGLAPVTDLTSAAAALQVIVEQGEGSRGESTVSHHGRFVAIQDEYEQILRDDPKFEPGRNAMRNPYSMLPNDIVDYGEVNLIDDPLSGDICNLFDGCYALLMQMFGRLLLHSGESELQLTRLADITVALMLEIIGPLGETLTSLPAGPPHPGMMAGPSFRLSRDVSSPPHQTAAWALFIERLKELSAYCAFLQIRGVMPEASVHLRGETEEAQRLLGEAQTHFREGGGGQGLSWPISSVLVDTRTHDVLVDATRRYSIWHPLSGRGWSLLMERPGVHAPEPPRNLPTKDGGALDLPFRPARLGATLPYFVCC